VKSNRPAERLLVDDIDEYERERKSESDSREIREHAEQAGFNKDLLAHLPGCCSEKTEQAELAAAVDDQSEKRTGDAHHGDNHGDGFERVGNGEGAIENADRFRAQIAV